MPVGAKFGVEKEKSVGKRKGNLLSGGDGPVKEAPTKDTLDASDRELCRLFVEMFQPVGEENIAAVFNDGAAADAARKKWKGDSTAYCNVVSISGRGAAPGSKKNKKSMGFAAKMAAEMDSSTSGPFSLPPGTEVALFVAPGPKELVAIERVCSEVGMGCCAVLLNARLGKYDGKFASVAATDLFAGEFEPVFHLAAAPQGDAPGCLVYRQFPEEWALARKPKVGPPKVFATSPNRFNGEQCREAYEEMEVPELEERVEGFIDNLAGWFK